MSKTIDERVVEMRFDNQQFENNVKNSISSLDSLKKGLNLSGAAKGLENIGASVKNVNMTPLSQGVNTLQSKFSALEVVAITALVNISNSAINTGKRMISALTIDPIKTGFKEYETQIGSIQTILANTASKGTSLQQVNNALAELNTYADKTIYNFTEMTRNIGTFTAAGVDLRTSVDSIKGIANLAAISGSTSQQASNAMYQLSQALATGTVKLQDWNSVVNAGMGGQVFQDALKRTATQMGVNVDSLIKKYGSFRESLTQGNWLTTEVLTETLKQFAGAYTEADLIQKGYSKSQAQEIMKMAETAVDAATKVRTFTQLFDTLKEAAQSGWTQSWEIMVGDFEEATNLLSEISDTIGNIINESATKRNELLSGGLSTGWKQLLNQGIHDADSYKESIKSVAKEHGVAVDDIIKNSGSFEKSLKEGWVTTDILTEALDKLTTKTKGLSEKQLEEMGYSSEQVTKLEALNKAVKDGSISLDEFAKKMSMVSGRENLIQALRNTFEGLYSVLKPIKEAFNEVFQAMTGEQLYALTEKLRDFTAKLKLSDSQGAKLKATFKGLFSAIDIGVTVVTKLVSGFVRLIGKLTGLGDSFLDITSTIGNMTTSVHDSIKEHDLLGVAIEGVLRLVQNGIDKFTAFKTAVADHFDISKFEVLKNVLGSILNFVKKVGVGIKNAFTNIFNFDNLSKGLDLLNKGLFAGILIGIKRYISGLTGTFSDSILGLVDKIKDTFGSLSGIFDSVRESLQAWQQNLKADILLKLAGAIAVLTASLLILSSIDPAKLTASLGSVTVLFANLMGAMALFSKLDPKGGFGLTIMAASMIELSVAVLILATAAKQLSDIDLPSLAKTLLGITVLLAEVVAASVVLSKYGGKSIKGATQMIIFAATIKVLASACRDLASMDFQSMMSGLLGVGLLLAAVDIFMNTAKISKGAIGTAIGIAIIAGAIKILASAVSDFGNMEWDAIKKGLASIGALLAEMIVFTQGTANAKHIIATALALAIIGASMKILASAMAEFSGMEWEGIGKGLISMGVALAIIGIAVSSMPVNMVAISVGLVVVSAALLILANALKQMSGMSWEEIARGLVALGGSMLILALGLHAMIGTLAGSAALLVAAAALAILTPVLKTLGGMSVGEIAKSLITLAAAFAIIGVAGVLLGPLVPVLIGLGAAVVLFGVGCLAAGVGITMLATGITALGVALLASATAIGSSIAVIANGVAESATAIGGAIKAVVLSLVDVIVECAPAIAIGFLKLLLEALKALATYTPQVVVYLADILIGIINALAEKLPELIAAAVNLIGAFFKGVIDALKGVDTATLLQGIAAVGLLSLMMIALGAVAALVPAAMVGVLGMGAIIAEMALVLAAIGAFAQIPGLDWLISEGGTFLQKIGTAIGQFIGGIVGGVAVGATSTLPQVGANLSSFMTSLKPFLDGAASIDASIMEGVKTLAETVLILTGAGLLEAVTSFITGGSSLATFANQLIPFGTAMVAYSNAVSGLNVEAITASATAGQALSTLADSLPKQDGWAQTIIGSKDLGTFGAQLNGFGSAMSSYSQSVAGLNVGSIVSSATAGKALSDLANALPEKHIFDGKVTLSKFGSQLISFGTSLSAFSSSVGNVGVGRLSGVVSEIKKLSDLVGSFSKTDFSGTSKFTTALANLGKVSVQGLVTSFSGASGRVTGSINNLINAMCSAATAGGAKVSSALSNVMTTSLLTVNRNGPMFQSAGSNIMVMLANGMKAGGSNVIRSIASTLKSAVGSISAFYSSFYSAGAHIISGLAAGIDANRFKAEAAARAAAKSALNAAEATLDINSPSKEFMKLGAFTVLGLAKGIDDNVKTSNEASTNLGLGVIKAFQEVLKIHSPSVVMDEFGHYIVQGLTEGIEANTSAEEAMQKKAQNIISAFKTELDKWDVATTTSDLEYKLWSIVNGSSANVAESFSKQFENLSKNYNYQLNKVRLAQGEYENALREFGPDSQETKKAYNKFLQEQITLAEISEKINEMQDNSLEAAKESYRLFIQYLTDAQASVDAGMITKEQAEEWAREKSGYTDAMAKIIYDSVNGITTAVESSLTSFTPTVAGCGTDYAAAVGTGITSGTPAVTTSSETVGTAAVTALKGTESKWKDTGKYLVEMFALGITENMFTAEAKAKAMAEAALRAARAAMSESIPVSAIVSNSTSSQSVYAAQASSMINSARKIKNSIAGIATSNVNPTITPVYSMDTLKKTDFKFDTKVTAIVGGPIKSLRTTVNDAKLEISKSNDKVVTAVKDLNQSIDDMNSRETPETALYVDSKKLASSIAKPMDRQLNILSKRRAY